MQDPLDESLSISLPNVDFEECASSVIPIDDDNYRAVIDWFKSCLSLSQNLPVANRDEYELKVIANVKNSLSNFFQRTELALSTLIGLEREVTAMFQGLGPPVGQYRLALESDDENCDPSCDGDDEVGDAISQLARRFLWVAIASIILLILLILVLITMCWLRNYIERDMKEIFIACPRDEMEGMGSKGTKGSMRSTKSTLSKRKTTESSAPEYPEDEDEDYLKDYGNQDPNAYAYPIRVWMTPLNRKQQPAHQGNCVAKKTGVDVTRMKTSDTTNK